MKKDRVGEKHTTNEGYEIEIIEYKNCHNCTVLFNDKNHTTLHNKKYSDIIKGEVGNPFYPSAFNIGF